MGIRRIDPEPCTGCGICVELCPMDVIRLNSSAGTPRAVIQYLRDCQSCALCESGCPEGAIWVLPCFERPIITAW